MKKVVFSIILLGLTGLGFSQESNEGITAVELAAVTVSALNSDYLTYVQNQDTPEVVQQLQNRAARFDVTALRDYNKKEKQMFETVFKATNGSLIAFYAKNGQIVSSMENFKDVVLPMTIRKRVFEANPGWKMGRNQYVSTYQDDRLIKKMYRIQLVQGGEKKRLTIKLNEK